MRTSRKRLTIGQITFGSAVIFLITGVNLEALRPWFIVPGWLLVIGSVMIWFIDHNNDERTKSGWALFGLSLFIVVPLVVYQTHFIDITSDFISDPNAKNISRLLGSTAFWFIMACYSICSRYGQRMFYEKKIEEMPASYEAVMHANSVT